MLNLVPVIKSLEDEIFKMKLKFEKKLEPYETSLREIRKINEACERCNGTGRVLRSRACAEDDRPDPKDSRDYNICPVCHGSGFAKPNLDKDISP